MRKFYYAVSRGRQPGIYSTWDQCEQQVLGYPNPRYRKFPTLSEAQHFCSLSETEPRLGFPKIVVTEKEKHGKEHQSAEKSEERLACDQDNLDVDSRQCERQSVNLDECVVAEEDGNALKEPVNQTGKEEFNKVTDVPSATQILQRQVDQSDKMKQRNKDAIIDTFTWIKQCADKNWHTTTGDEVKMDELKDIIDRTIQLMKHL